MAVTNGFITVAEKLSSHLLLRPCVLGHTHTYDGSLKSSWTGGSVPLLYRGRR
jgi:hypothetical protein